MGRGSRVPRPPPRRSAGALPPKAKPTLPVKAPASSCASASSLSARHCVSSLRRLAVSGKASKLSEQRGLRPPLHTPHAMRRQHVGVEEAFGTGGSGGEAWGGLWRPGSGCPPARPPRQPRPGRAILVPALVIRQHIRFSGFCHAFAILKRMDSRLSGHWAEHLGLPQPLLLIKQIQLLCTGRQFASTRSKAKHR